MTEPNEFDVFRTAREGRGASRRILVMVLDVLTALALLAIVAVVLKMILY